ncbi:MAG: rRNA maturation RNase YbeY [Bacillota bacterium]|nr:rRNA maturation RNase YbeY [Bacillota bacterium]
MAQTYGAILRCRCSVPGSDDGKGEGKGEAGEGLVAGVPVEIVNLQDTVDVNDDLAAQLERAVTIGLSCERMDPTGVEVSIALVDDGRIRELNRQFRGKDAATDVLSFGMDDKDVPEEPAILGDIVISLETAAREAPETGGVARHAVVLAIHGLLHLLGYDHDDDRDAEEMEAREREILARVSSQAGPDDPCAASGGSDDQ